MLAQWLRGRAARQRWEKTLVWFRLRYLTPEGPQRCLQLLSRPQACGRVALYFQPSQPISQLFLGVPETHLRLLQQMAADFGLSLKPSLPEENIPPIQPLTAVVQLPWDKPFMAHIVNESVFVTLLEERNKGSYLPAEISHSSKRPSACWQLPANPLSGISLQSTSWDAVPARLVTPPTAGRSWCLGYLPEGLPIQVNGAVNVYGRQEAVAEWLTHQITQMLAVDHAGLVVIDGAGDLVPHLKRKATITRLLGEQLRYIDLDANVLTTGFNPLAATPNETSDKLMRRWQRWFSMMGAHPDSGQMLNQAHDDGILSLVELQKWLKQKQLKGYSVPVASLQMLLNRLMRKPLREWLEWPTNLYDGLPEGSLFFACKATGWERLQILRAVLLGVLNMANLFVIVHGFPWQAADKILLDMAGNIVVGNGPQSPSGTVVLTESHVQGGLLLADRFFAGDAVARENLALLRLGEGIVVADGQAAFATWAHRLLGEGPHL